MDPIDILLSNVYPLINFTICIFFVLFDSSEQYGEVLTLHYPSQ